MSSRHRKVNTERIKLSRGVVYHNYDGYYYKKNVQKDASIYLKCINSNCPVRGIANANLHGPIRISQVKEHNHMPDHEFLSVNKWKSKVLQRCENEPTSVHLIYDEEIAKLGEQKAGKFVENTFVNTMKRRKMLSYKQVKSLKEYAELLKNETYKNFSNTLDGEKFFQGLVNDQTILFISPTTKVLLSNNAITFAIDRVFKFVPAGFEKCQLISMLAICPNKAIAVAFAVVENANVGVYVNLFLKIKQIVPNCYPTTFITDYDVSIQDAISIVFPYSTITSCWFHFSQALRAKIHYLGLLEHVSTDEKLHNYIKMCICLPILPAESMEEGFFDVSKLIREHTEEPQIVAFLDYIYHYWILGVTPEQLSVYSDAKRINNYYEVYHGYLLKYMGGRTKNGICSDMWRLTRGLIKLEHYYSTLFKLKRCNDLQNRHDFFFTIKDSKLSTAWNVFAEDHISVTVFLKTISNTILDISLYDDDYYPLILEESFINSLEGDDEEMVIDCKVENVFVDENSLQHDIKNEIDDLIVEEIYYEDESDRSRSNIHNVNDESNKKSTENCPPRIGNCAVCFVEKRSVACIPCGHLCVCETCKCKYSKDICPICSIKITGLLTVQFC